MNLLRVEMRRALRRRAVRVLIALALLGCTVAGLVAFLGSRGKTVTELRLDEEAPETQALIAEFGRVEYGRPLFLPDAVTTR